MTREEIREKALAINNPIAEYTTVYELLDELGITYKKTNCNKCRLDLYNILREELGIIEDASEESNFNNIKLINEQPATVLKDDSQQVQTVLRYVWPRPVSWRGHIINDRTPESVKREFHKTHKGFYIEQAIIPFETK